MHDARSESTHEADIAKLLGAGAGAAAWRPFRSGVTPVRAQAGSYEGVTMRGLGLAEAA